jgi:hypothetical protein
MYSSISNRIPSSSHRFNIDSVILIALVKHQIYDENGNEKIIMTNESRLEKVSAYPKGQTYYRKVD